MPIPNSHPFIRLFSPASPLIAIREKRATLPAVVSFYFGIVLLLISIGSSLKQWSHAPAFVAFCWLLLAGYCVALGNILPWGRDKKGTNRYLEVMAAVMLILLVIVANPAARILLSHKTIFDVGCTELVTQHWTLCLPRWAIWANGAGCLFVALSLVATLFRRKAASSSTV